VTYFKLDFSTDLKEIGPEYPQAGPCKSYNFKGAQSYFNIHFNKFPEFIPDLNYFEIHRRAPFTDVVSSGLSFGMIISQKLKTLLQDYNLVETRYYPMQLRRGAEENKEYYWMHPISSFIEFVDFKRTKFFVDTFGKRGMDLEISTAEELHELRGHYIEQNKFVKAQTVYLIHDFEKLGLDLFLTDLTLRILISESLKATIIQEKITGVEISKSNVVLSP